MSNAALQVQPTGTYAMIMRMAPCIKNSPASIIIFKDGKVFVQRQETAPHKPIIFECEGDVPTDDQLEALQLGWLALSMEFDIPVLGFCDTLLPYARDIRGGEVITV